MEALLSIALSNAVVASVLAVAAAIVARFCRRPAVTHALWLLVLLKLLTPSLGLLRVTWPSIDDNALSSGETLSPTSALPSGGEPAESEASPEEPSDSEPVPHTAVISATAFWEYAVLGLWLSGSLALWTIAGARLRRFHRLLRQAPAAPEAVQEQARRLATLLGLRRCPPISLVSAALSPMLWALGFSPRLLVPSDLWQCLSVEQRDTLLAHELAHLRRGDHWVRRLELIVLGLYWWYPVAWWARRRLQEAEEECCDARVVAVLPEAASAYASALVETVTFLSHRRAAALVGASGAGQVPLLKRRLTMIMTANPSSRPSRAGFWTVLGFGALLLPLTPGAAQTEPTDRPRRDESKGQPVDTARDTISFTQLLAKPKYGVSEIQNCVSCHQASVHSRDLQHKPQSWRHAHDEAVRLMDEVLGKRGQLREAGNRVPAPTERERAEQIEKLQDEIELLKVQVQVKQAHLEATKVELAEIEKLFERMRAASNSIPPSQLSKAQTDMIAQRAQIRIREAELQEPLVRLKQAERRLARLQRPAERSPAGGREQQEQRLRELEKKVNQLLDEMKALQREMSPEKPRALDKEH